MAKNVKAEAQLKGRQTKLRKRTYEELIAIILKKDKTERNLNNQVVNLKREVNTLTTRVNNFDKDQEGNIRAIEDWKAKYNEKCNLIDRLNENANTQAGKITDLNFQLNEASKATTAANEKCKSYKNLMWVSLGFAVLCLLGWIFC